MREPEATVERWALALRALATSSPEPREALGMLVPKAACFVEAEHVRGEVPRESPEG